MRIGILLVILSLQCMAIDDEKLLSYYLSREHTYENIMSDIKKDTAMQIRAINKVYVLDFKKKDEINRLNVLTWPNEKEMMAYILSIIIREQF
jgi:hypothetical protein